MLHALARAIRADGRAVTQTVGCGACLHPRVADIDAMLSAGQSNAAVGRAVGLHKDAIRRHRTNGHVVPVAGVGSAPPGGPAAPSGDMLVHLRGQLAALDAIDTKAISPSQKLGLFEAKRRTAAEIARLDPPVPPRPAVVTLDQVAEWPALVDAMSTALEPFPEARQALAKVLRERMKA